MSLDKLKKDTDNLHLVKASLDAKTKEVLQQLKNKEIPLKDRWEIYTSLVKCNTLNNNDPFGDGFIGKLGSDLTVYDHFYIERYQTASFTDIYETILDAEEEWNEVLFAAREKNLEAWQEAVLESGYSSFTYDW